MLGGLGKVGGWGGVEDGVRGGFVVVWGGGIWGSDVSLGRGWGGGVRWGGGKLKGASVGPITYSELEMLSIYHCKKGHKQSKKSNFYGIIHAKNFKK